MHCPNLKAINNSSMKVRVQELCESRGGRPGLPVLMSLTVSVDVKQHWTLSLICQPTSKDIKLYIIIISMNTTALFRTCSEDRPQELREVEVDVLGSSSLIVRTVSVDVKQHWTLKAELVNLWTLKTELINLWSDISSRDQTVTYFHQVWLISLLGIHY